MPHIHLEYSDNIENLEPKAILLALNQALFDADYFSPANDIKSRATCQQDYVIGLGDVSQAYVHVKVSLLTGRSMELQQDISQLLLATLEQHLPAQSQLSLQLCVEMVEMQKASYAKKVI